VAATVNQARSQEVNTAIMAEYDRGDGRSLQPPVVVAADRLGNLGDDGEDLSRSQELEPFEPLDYSSSDAALLAARCLILLFFLISVGVVRSTIDTIYNGCSLFHAIFLL